jgi:uncharacterized membrane protein
MDNQTEEKYIHRIFDIGIILKGIDGLLEIVGGLLLIFIRPETINGIVAALTQYELVEDPQDLIANFILRAIHLTSQSQIFGILFLLSHGIIKVFIVAGLLKNKLWAYPAGIVIFSGFGIYQLYRYFHTYSLGLLLLTILDVFVIILTWHEYKIVKQKE